MVEIYFNVQSDNGSITESHALRRWSLQLMRSMEDIKDLRVGNRLRTLLTASGFTEVDVKMIPMPLSPWPNSMTSALHRSVLIISPDPTSREIGAVNEENVTKLLESLSLYSLTRRLRMPHWQYGELISQAREEVRDRNLKAYFPL